MLVCMCIQLGMYAGVTVYLCSSTEILKLSSRILMECCNWAAAGINVKLNAINYKYLLNC